MKNIGPHFTGGEDSDPALKKTDSSSAGDFRSEMPAGNQPGKIVEKIAYAQEDAHWREHHASQSFARHGMYDEFFPAYRAGYEGYFHFGLAGKKFEETETQLRERYETENGLPKLPWTVVRPASHAAWQRVAGEKL